MPKIKRPTDLLIKENALRLLWELFEIYNSKHKSSSGYNIAKKLGLDNNLIYDYMNRWGNLGLVIVEEDNNKFYYSLNPVVFSIGKKSISFTINNIKIRLQKIKK